MNKKNLQFNDEISYIEESGNQEENYSSSEDSSNRDPNKMTTKYHEQQSHEALQTLKDIMKEKNWKKVLMHKSGITVYSKPGVGENEKTPIYMARHEIKGFTPQSIFAVIGMRKLWDEWYDEGSLVENLNETTSLTYIVMHGLAGSKPRDMSLVEKIECTSNGTIYFVSTSVNTPKVPQIVGKDRITLLLNGWIIEPVSISPLCTRVTYVHQSRFRGWIPSVIAKKYLARRPLALYTIDTYLQKNGPPKIYVRHDSSSRNSDWSNFSNISFETSEDNNDDNENINTKRLSIHDYNVNLKDFNIENNDNNIPNESLNIDNNNNNINNNNIISNDNNNIISNNNNINISSSNKIIRRKISTANEEEGKTKFQPKKAEARVAPEYTSEIIHSINDNEKSNTLNTLNTLITNNDNKTNEKVLSKEHITPEYSPVETPVELLSSSKISQSSKIKIEEKEAEEILPPPKQKIIHKYTEISRKAFERLKSHSDLSGWTFYCENKGVKIYQKDNGRPTPIVRGDSIITGFTVEEILSVAENLDFRKLWDERFEEGTTYERWGLDEMLTRSAMKGNFLVSGRDLSLFSRVDRDPETGTVWFTNTSVIDSTIPENKKFVRANLITAGWILKPNFNSSKSIESVNAVYLVDIDIKLDTVPSSILKSINLQTPMCVHKVNEIMHKHGFPPFISRLESIKLINNELDIKTFQTNFTFKPSKEEGIIEIHTSKIMYPNGFDITIISQNVKVEFVPNHPELIRITKFESNRIDEIKVQITKYTSGRTRITCNGDNKIPLASASPPKKINKVIEKSTSKSIESIDQKTITPQNTLETTTTTPENSIKIITPKNVLRSITPQTTPQTTPQNTIKSITPLTTPQNTIKSITPQTTPQNTIKSITPLTTPRSTLRRTTPQNTLKNTTPQNTLKSIPFNDSNQINIRHVIQEKTSNSTLITDEDTILPQNIIHEKMISNSTLVEEEDIVDPQLIIDNTSYPKHFLQAKSLFVNDDENKDLENDNEIKTFEAEKRFSNESFQQSYLNDTTSIKNDNQFNFDDFFKNINLNSQQIGIIFVSMVLSYFAGRFSTC